MRYEKEDAYEVLEDVIEKLKYRVDTAERSIKQTYSNIDDMKKIIRDINEFLDSQRCVAVNPAYCKHTHKKITDDGKYETVTCADCGLMLSYVLI